MFSGFNSNAQYVWGVCTHIYYAFASISGNTLTGSTSDYKLVQSFKAQNPSLKVLLSVGGEYGASQFQQLVANPGNVGTWAKNAVNYAKNNGFNGIDIDWEFPSGYKDQFTNLIKSLKVNTS